MRELSLNELDIIHGGTTFEDMSGWERFWAAYAPAAGASAGYFSGPVLALLAGVGAAVYYLIYTPLYYVAYGTAVAVGTIASGIYAAGAGIGNMLSS